MSEFSPAWFLPGPHAQTIWGRLTRPRRLVHFQREVLTTPDGDELVLDHLDAPMTAKHPLRFILMHGLEGSSYSVYMQGVLAVVARQGHIATAINFRSCARDPRHLSHMLPNRRPRFYHSGDTGDFAFVLSTLAARAPRQPIVAFGASLGGNVLLKWLGENPAQRNVLAAATLSVPYDLGAGSKYLELTAAGRFYVARFLRTLKRKITRPDIAPLIDIERALHTRTFWDFDDAATAPLHGFADAQDYYTRSSSIHFLDRIATPTLALSSVDDPFVPPEAIERAKSAAARAIDFRTTPAGGHVGFIGGRMPWRCEYWAEELVVQWLIEQAEKR